MIEIIFITMLLICLAIPIIGVLLVVSGFNDNDAVKTIGWAICNNCGCGSLKYDDLSDHDGQASKQIKIKANKI